MIKYGKLQLNARPQKGFHKYFLCYNYCLRLSACALPCRNPESSVTRQKVLILMLADDGQDDSQTRHKERIFTYSSNTQHSRGLSLLLLSRCETPSNASLRIHLNMEKRNNH